MKRTADKCAAPEGTLELVNISVSLAGSSPSWNDDVNLRLGAVRAAEIGALAAEPGLAGLEAVPGAGSAGATDAARGGTPGQVPTQARGADLQALPAGSTAAGAAGGTGSLRMPGEDWFESSLPAETPSSAGAVEPAGLTQAFHANLAASPAANPGTSPVANLVANPNLVTNLGTDLKSHPLLDAGLITAAIAPERLSSAYRVVPEAVSIQASAAMATKAGQKLHDRGVRGIGLDDQLMDEIPLLFAQVPVERQPAPMRVRLGIVLVDGLLMAGAVLAAAVLATLNLKELPSITEMGVGAAAVVFVAALIHVTVRRSFRRFSAARQQRRAPGPAERR